MGSRSSVTTEALPVDLQVTGGTMTVGLEQLWTKAHKEVGAIN